MAAAGPGASLSAQSSAAFFLVLRRMRGPLILIIAVFGIGVIGLSLIPGDSPEGPWRMGIFDSFYFMSYTATTIGYGEIPKPFNTAQRLWVVFTIFLGVVSWAYAIGRLLALLQQSAFRDAWALQRFRRRAAGLREPFWVVVGHGQTGELVGRGIDRLGRRFVAIDTAQERIDVLELGAYSYDVPAIVGDGRDPELLAVAGLVNPLCSGVLALTDDDEANLAVVMAAATLRPGLTVIARCQSPDVARRMEVFGAPTVINPFDRFGDHFRVELRAPAIEQLAHWISAPPGSPLPTRVDSMREGAWVVCGYGRFGEEITRDLRAAGVPVTVIDHNRDVGDQSTLRGDATDPGYLAVSGVSDAAGFVAGTDNDTTNLSLVAAARRVNPAIVVVARQNQPSNADLFAAMDIDLLMVPSKVVAEEALAYIGTPTLRVFLVELGRRDNAWAAALLERIRASSGDGSPHLWTVVVEPASAPALCRALARNPGTVGDLVRDPAGRDDRLAAVPLLCLRDGAADLEPPDDRPLAVGDRVLMAGEARAEHAMLATLQIDTTAEYVLTGQELPAGWLWRKLSGTSTGSS